MAKSAEGKTLVIVESPTKARTIRKFLGKDYVVESCMGHVRDLPQSAKDIPEKIKKEPWAHLGVNVDKKFDPIYCVPKNKTKIVQGLKTLLKDAEELILATDEDREGESISWHLLELLKPKVPVKRMVFHEITKEAIKEALGNFREIDSNLVRAQEARRILDRLVGYTISPLVWKKVAYGLSAGRVQSVAVNLISERELERKRFVTTSFCGLLGQCEKSKIGFDAKMSSYQGKKIASGKDFDGLNGGLKEDLKSSVLHLEPPAADKILKELSGEKWAVVDVEEKPVSRKPAPPFITSTLQQEANRKLGMGSRETMQVAQKLYEQGYITYMRTDSTTLSKQALVAARSCIEQKYGKEYLPDEPREYRGKKAKGAQEAHEAIRPAGTEFVAPEDTKLSAQALKLYDLIWKRTVGSQMVNSRQKQVQVKFEVGEAIFSASGMTIEFPGFLRAYVEGRDDADAALEDREVRLPALKVGDSLDKTELSVTNHETKPPARFTEATLVQTMEREGIGRPSTYAAIISTIIDRGYVRKQGNALSPTFTALVVAKLLRENLPAYVDVDFTSEMERSLDDIADGGLDSVNYLQTVYFGDKGLKAQVEEQESSIDPEKARCIHLHGLKGLEIRVGRYGAYVCRQEDDGEVCASLPESQVPAEMTAEIAHKLIDQKINGADSLGKDPETGLPVYVLNGRYGPYVQLGDSEAEKEKPKRVSIPPTMDPETIDFKAALQLLELPKTLGEHPETGKVIKAGIGRFGPYIVCDGDFRSIPKTESIFETTFERAMELLSQPKKTRGRATPIKEFGKYPDTEHEMQVFNGRYGPYVKCGRTNVSIPEDIKPEDLTKEQALELLEPKMGSKKKAKKKKAAKKAGGKKKVAKKTATKKKTKTAKKKTAASSSASKVVLRRKSAES